MYRWWADEEFGTIFTHDHCFANFRQKHGLFAALLVEPENATFHHPISLEPIIAGAEAVIKFPDNVQNAYREFCLGNADWVPLFKLENEEAEHAEMPAGHDMDAEHFVANYELHAHGGNTSLMINYGKAIEAPDHQDSHDDNGVFSVNYKCEPLAERKNDPSEWFNSKEFIVPGEHDAPDEHIQYGDPATPIFKTIAGEPIRLRLVQGSHEEQHSFEMHGMRWRRFWKDARSPIKNQQTLGISEAFSFDIKDNYGTGDFLWKYASAEDLWLGSWGFIRSLSLPEAEAVNLPPLVGGYIPVEPMAHPPLENCRRFKIRAVPQTIQYNSVVSDPFGLVYQLIGVAAPNKTMENISPSLVSEPLVLRCRKGEWVAIEVANELTESEHDVLEVEPMAPQLPHNDDERIVSKKVSLHVNMLSYDVKTDDGANVGLNPDTNIEFAGAKTYFFHADVLGPAMFEDMADFRNHRHHGLIGAIIVHPETITPIKVQNNRATAGLFSKPIWYGTRVSLRERGSLLKTEEQVLFIQDGLRYYLYGNPTLPIGDIPGDAGEALPDTEDQGLKGFNYKSEPTSHTRGYNFKPSTPIILVPANANVQLHLIGACDKPRNHSFTIHGHSWKEYDYLRAASPQMSSVGGISSGYANTLKFKANDKQGNYMYRSGVLKHVVEQGLWGILKVI